MQIKITSLEEIDNAAREFFEKNLQTQEGRISCIAFYGKMGAGKTTFIKALCKELAIEDNVTSPTFALINEYSSPEFGPVFHFDFYRIKKREEVFDLGYEDYFYSKDLCLIEWPEIVEDLLPENYLKVNIEAQQGEQRVLHIKNI